MKKVSLTLLTLILTALFVVPAGILADSIEEKKKASELDQQNVIARYNLGFAYYQNGQADNAIDVLKQTLDLNKADKAAHAKVDSAATQMLGILYFNEKQNDDEAINWFKKAIELTPGSGDNYYFMGLAMARKQNYEEALAAFDTSLKKGTENAADANFRIGQICYKRGDADKAEAYLKKAIESNPKNQEALELLGIIYHKKGDAEKAKNIFEKVVKLNSTDFNSYYILGLSYYQLKEYDKMIGAYKEAIKINPNFPDAHYNLGMAYFFRNMYEDAISELEKAKELNPSDAATFALLGQSKDAAYDYHMKNGATFITSEEFGKAKQELELALKARADDQQAENLLSSLKEMITKDVQTRNPKAKKYFSEKKYTEALYEWQAVLAEDPENSEAKDGVQNMPSGLKDMAKAKEKKANEDMATGDLAGALKEYKDAASNAKDKDNVKHKISTIQTQINKKIKNLLSKADKSYASGGYKAALDDYNEILKYDENNEKALDGLTRVNAKIEDAKAKYLDTAKRIKSQDKSRAISLLKKVLALDPTNAEANKYIEELTGSKSEIAANAQQIKKLYYEGVDKYVNGDIEDAIKIWKKVLSLDPSYTEAKKNIGRAQEKLAAIKNLTNGGAGQ